MFFPHIFIPPKSMRSKCLFDCRMELDFDSTPFPIVTYVASNQQLSYLHIADKMTQVLHILYGSVDTSFPFLTVAAQESFREMIVHSISSTFRIISSQIIKAGRHAFKKQCVGYYVEFHSQFIRSFTSDVLNK